MPQNKLPGRVPPIWVSQNFLTSTKTIQRIMQRTSINADDHVVEIGPGKGHITSVLLNKCKHVTAIEIDTKLYEKLKGKFSYYNSLTLKNIDFLKWQLPTHGSYKIFSNIPFNITTDILRKITECKNPPEEAWLVMEKGAAKRFMGKPYETLRSLLLKPFFELSISYYFCRDDFHPKPSVDVVLLYLKKKQKPDIPAEQRQLYEKFISKGIQNGVHGFSRMFTKHQLSKAKLSAGIQNDNISGQMKYVQWLCLFRCYSECSRNNR